jgi:hypothetical protein
MNYFLVGIREGISGIIAQVTTWGDGFISTLLRLSTFEGQTTLIAQSLIQIILNYTIAFAFFIFSALFILRYLAIWILVILSPLAFVFWILPATKKFWNMWWSNFIQWSIVGIPAAFFLYLAARVYEVLPSVYKTKFEMPGIDPVITGFLDQVFPFFIVVIFLLLGFIIGLQTSAMGAGTVISLAKRGGKAAGKWAAKRGWAKIEEKIPEGVRKVGERLATYTPKGKAAQVLGAPIWAIGRAMGRAIGPAIVTAEKQTAKTAEKKWTGALYARKVSALLDAASDAERAGIISAFSEDNEIEKLLRDDRVKRFLTELRMRKIAKKAGEIDEAKKVIPAFLPKGTREEQNKWLSDVGVKVSDWEKKTFNIKDEVDKVVGRAKPANVKYFSSEALAGEGAQEAMHKFWHGAHISEAAREFGKIFVDAFQKKGNALGMKWYKTNNKPLVKYWSSSAAQALGLKPPPEKGAAGHPTPPGGAP